MKSNIITSILIATTLSAGLSSCDRYLDITPTGRVVPQTEADFRALLTRAYNLYPEHKSLLNLKSDEVQAGNTNEMLKPIYTWEESGAVSNAREMPYASFYQVIFHTNYIIQNIDKYNVASAEVHQILGEAYALRAYTYFQLLGIYAPAYTGDNGGTPAVPLVTQVQLEGVFPRATLDEVYQQIFSDVSSAEQLLNQKQFEAGYNYRFSTAALYAFKARVYQYRKDWHNAIKAADAVLAINSHLEDFNQFTLLPSHYQSKESIMNLDLPISYTTNAFSRASDAHIALYDQVNDLRFSKYFKQNNNGTWQSTKYNSNDYKCSFRVAEIMLIKAEAQAMNNEVEASKKTLLSLAKTRYNAEGFKLFQTKINQISAENYYTELLKERARELSFEGLRWADLRRTTQPEIVHVFDGVSYTLSVKDPRYTLPFPKEARLKNPDL